MSDNNALPVKNKTYTVNMIVIKVLSWICLVGTIFFSGAAVEAGQVPALIFFVPFGTLLLFAILLSGSAELSDEGIKVIIPIGVFYMKWEEVEYVKICSGNMVIGNKVKNISYSTPDFWSGKDNYEAHELFIKVLRDKKIYTKRKINAFLPQYKNTRI